MLVCTYLGSASLNVEIIELQMFTESYSVNCKHPPSFYRLIKNDFYLSQNTRQIQTALMMQAL